MRMRMMRQVGESWVGRSNVNDKQCRSKEVDQTSATWAWKGKRSRTLLTGNNRGSCAEGGSQSSGASMGPSDADKLAEVLEQIKALQEHNAKLTKKVLHIAEKVGDVEEEEDEEEEIDTDEEYID